MSIVRGPFSIVLLRPMLTLDLLHAAQQLLREKLRLELRHQIQKPACSRNPIGSVSYKLETRSSRRSARIQFV